jgi:hypothetical protein
MNRSSKIAALGLLALAGAFGVAAAQARSNVYFSVDVGVPLAHPWPVYLAPPAVVYPLPPVLYLPPRVVYAPRPFYVRPGARLLLRSARLLQRRALAAPPSPA